MSELKGRNAVARAFEREVGCAFGSVSDDGQIGLFSTPCIGMSDQEPVAIIDNKIYTRLTPYRVVEIVKALKKNGNRELQAFAYKYQIMAPRFPYQYNDRDIDAYHPYILHDRNRCISCKRCIRMVLDDKGRSAFSFRRRGHELQVVLDQEIGENMSEEMANYAMEVCPVGSILKKEIGFEVPIGERQFDYEPIGSDVAATKE